MRHSAARDSEGIKHGEEGSQEEGYEEGSEEGEEGHQEEGRPLLVLC